jgi:hypothetical protein
MIRHRRIFPPVTGSKWLDRSISIVFWLLMVSFAFAIFNNLLFGGHMSGASFGLGGPYIHYQVRNGRLLGDRLEYAVITQVFPKNQWSDGSTYTFLFTGHNPLTVRLKRGQTLWVDQQGRVTSLGQKLDPRDCEALRLLADDRTLSISSLEEFLAVAGLTADAGSPGH